MLDCEREHINIKALISSFNRTPSTINSPLIEWRCVLDDLCNGDLLKTQQPNDVSPIFMICHQFLKEMHVVTLMYNKDISKRESFIQVTYKVQIFRELF